MVLSCLEHVNDEFPRDTVNFFIEGETDGIPDIVPLYFGLHRKDSPSAIYFSFGSMNLHVKDCASITDIRKVFIP